MDPSYTNSFGQFGASGANVVGDVAGAGPGGSAGPIVSPVASPVVSGGNDVVLPLSKNNGGNKRRWLIIVGVLLLLVAIGVGVGAWIVSQPRGGDTISDVKTSFNKYANYLLYGIDSGEYFGESRGPYYVYYFDKQNIQVAMSEEEQKEIVDYYVNLSGKIADFYASYVGDGESSNASSIVDSYMNDVSSFSEINETVIWGVNIVRQLYDENGYDAALRMIEQHYSALTSSQYFVSGEVGEILLKINKYYLDEYAAYSSVGCVTDDDIVYECGNDKLPDFEADVSELELSLDAVIENNRWAVLNGCWRVYEII